MREASSSTKSGSEYLSGFSQKDLQGVDQYEKRCVSNGGLCTS
jgi:hypothetical protein